MRKPLLERRIRSLGDLQNTIESLNFDEGVRVLGRIERLRGGGLMFITTVHSDNKITQKYCVNITELIYNKQAKLHVPGEIQEFLYFPNINDIMEYLKKNAARPIRGWYY